MSRKGTGSKSFYTKRIACSQKPKNKSDTGKYKRKFPNWLANFESVNKVLRVIAIVNKLIPKSKTAKKNWIGLKLECIGACSQKKIIIVVNIALENILYII